jgi:uncharacterized protein
VIADEVRVVYRKYDGSLHWNQTMRRLGEDEHGIWLGCQAGSSARRGYEPPVFYTHAYVLLIPKDGWWTATFNDLSERWVEIYCDVTTVPQWPGSGEVTMVDLDLDVLRRWDGTLETVDEDEFEEHRIRYGYPPDVVHGARRAAQWLHAAIGQNADPFGYRGWLAQVRPA